MGGEWLYSLELLARNGTRADRKKKDDCHHTPLSISGENIQKIFESCFINFFRSQYSWFQTLHLLFNGHLLYNEGGLGTFLIFRLILPCNFLACVRG